MTRPSRIRPKLGTRQEIQARAQSLSLQRNRRLASIPPASHSEAMCLEDPLHRVTFILSISGESLCEER